MKIGYAVGNYEQLKDADGVLDCMEKVNRYDITATGFSYYEVSWKDLGSCYARYGAYMNHEDDFGYQSCFVSLIGND